LLLGRGSLNDSSFSGLFVQLLIFPTSLADEVRIRGPDGEITDAPGAGAKKLDSFSRL